ncbi:unnamed protein product [marine sediment metagenome]|uniref:Uncharacterized protein n=1 Tax=marine sediment metagenome TaxID=412755 RepID=X1DX10_9ZZZZ
MNGKDKEEIIKAIGSLKSDIAVLKEKNEHMEKYIFKDLKPDIENLCNKVESCMEKADECYHKNFKWMITTVITSAIAISCVIGLIVAVVI